MTDTSNATWAVTIARLSETIKQRAGDDPKSSYTASLLHAGVQRCAKKFGEEAVEAVIAATAGDKAALTQEAADVVYHLLVLLAAGNVTLDDVAEALASREGQSGHAEKASRKA